MAVQTVQNLPAQFVQDLGEDLAKQVVAQSGVPIVTQGLGALQDAAQKAGLPLGQQTFETDEQFKARKGLFDDQQRAALAFDQRQLALQGIRPTVADQDTLQTAAQRIAQTQAGLGTTQEGLGTFQPFLEKAQTAATAGTDLLSGIASQNLLGTGVDTRTPEQKAAGDPASVGSIESYMSPYQKLVIDATLEEFDRNVAQREQQIRDQQTALGALGSGRAGVQLAEFGTGAARERALLQAGLLQQGFGQAQAARQQDIANRFGLGAAQQGIAGATQNLGAFQSGLAGQQAALGAQQQALQGTDIGRLGQLGALNQAQAQAQLDAQREAARQATFLPQEQLDRFAGQVTGIMGGYPAQFQTTNVPNPTPLQTALGIGTTLAGVYGALGRGFGGDEGFGGRGISAIFS